jgi:hypothetical protein
MNQPLENAGSSTFSSAPPLHSLRFGGESVEDTIHHRGKEIGEIAQRSKIKALMQISGKESRAANPSREHCPLSECVAKKMQVQIGFLVRFWTICRYTGALGRP